MCSNVETFHIEGRRRMYKILCTEMNHLKGEREREGRKLMDGAMYRENCL